MKLFNIIVCFFFFVNLSSVIYRKGDTPPSINNELCMIFCVVLLFSYNVICTSSKKSKYYVAPSYPPPLPHSHHTLPSDYHVRPSVPWTVEGHQSQLPTTTEQFYCPSSPLGLVPNEQFLTHQSDITSSDPHNQQLERYKMLQLIEDALLNKKDISHQQILQVRESIYHDVKSKK
jgi:hypothetical protein